MPDAKENIINVKKCLLNRKDWRTANKVLKKCTLSYSAPLVVAQEIGVPL